MDSDLQSLEDALCETVDTDITMEAAQDMLDRWQPVASALKESYPAMKELGGWNHVARRKVPREEI